jgi:hypothetical protein
VNRRYRPRGLYLWLALLTFLAVFAATADARETRASRTEAAPDARRDHAYQPDHHSLGRLERRAKPSLVRQQRHREYVDRAAGNDRRDHRPTARRLQPRPVSLTPTGTYWSSITTPFTPVNGDLPGSLGGQFCGGRAGWRGCSGLGPGKDQVPYAVVPAERRRPCGVLLLARELYRLPEFPAAASRHLWDPGRSAN